MARTAREPAQPSSTEHVRRVELARPAHRQWDFSERQAKRWLEKKERPRWAPIAYGVFFAALLTIFCISYTTYAFSEYRGQILPGVSVDNMSLAGLSHNQAVKLLETRLDAIHAVHFQLFYRGRSRTQVWNPSPDDLGVRYNPSETVKLAEAVGRTGPFLAQLIDRLPLHPRHQVPLLYHANEAQLRTYLQSAVASNLHQPKVDANLAIDKQTGVVRIQPGSSPGATLNLAAAERIVHAALGSLSPRKLALEVNAIPPVITDAAALRVKRRVEAFLSHPPVISVGKRVIVTSRADFGPMLSFQRQYGRGWAAIKMTVYTSSVSAYVAKLASQIDRQPQNAKVQFAAGQAHLISPRKTGRALQQDIAFTRLLATVKSLKANARLRFPVTVTQPPIDLTNPASTGINTLVATGQTSFSGSGRVRLADITAIAAKLDGVLISPGEVVSFNALVSNPAGWESRVYDDREAENGSGQLVPGKGGAMQQVATTFLRALYWSGLTLRERHPHAFRLGWYEPPVGLDAVVDPSTGKDLVFSNSTNKYLLLQTRVEPIRHELYVYVYGPRLGWHVDIVDKVTRTYPHGSAIMQVDSTLAPGDVRQIFWAHDGADTVVQRTVTLPNGDVKIDKLVTSYKPSRAVMLVGSVQPTATPGVRKQRKGATATPLPAPTATPTFSH